jgi:hypothetical protein
MAAPAFAALIALSAISFGLRGTSWLRSCVLPDPVTAQVIKTSRLRFSGISFSKIIIYKISFKENKNFAIFTNLKRNRDNNEN